VSATLRKPWIDANGWATSDRHRFACIGSCSLLKALDARPFGALGGAILAVILAQQLPAAHTPPREWPLGSAMPSGSLRARNGRSSRGVLLPGRSPDTRPSAHSSDQPGRRRRRRRERSGCPITASHLSASPSRCAVAKKLHSACRVTGSGELAACRVKHRAERSEVRRGVRDPGR
jgi:hypothetical protein